MSEQNNEKAKSSVSTIVATAIVALAAVAAIIVLIVMNNSSEGEQNRGSSDTISVDFKDTQEFADECGENAQKLVAGNYRVLRLFISEGLPHQDEPYGNRPEDGYYTAVSDEFKTYEDLESYVNSIFTEQEARRILKNMPLDPAAAAGTSDPDSSGGVSLYWSRDEYVDSGTSYVKQSVLGINASFKPYTDYKKPWGSTSIRIVPVSEEECELTVYLGADKDVDLSSVEESDILHTKMIKENGEWRLAELVF